MMKYFRRIHLYQCFLPTALRVAAVRLPVPRIRMVYSTRLEVPTVRLRVPRVLRDLVHLPVPSATRCIYYIPGIRANFVVWCVRDSRTYQCFIPAIPLMTTVRSRISDALCDLEHSLVPRVCGQLQLKWYFPAAM